MLLSKATLLALLPFLVQTFAHPSGKTLASVNDDVDEALMASGFPVKRQDDGPDDGLAALYDQCGGIGFDGYTQCEQGSSCQYSNDYYSQCLSDTAVKRQDDGSGDDTTDDDGTTTDDGTSDDTPDTSGTDAGQAAQYEQCGGIQFTGPTTCVSPYACRYSNDYYSQCL
ncbi:carbohydrate-binding module family 1 protein [Stipitochalara longipes BDJ]|nr:carbohydrate-binding module family 1 protein [Stipitochalara longipes BDJ]